MLKILTDAAGRENLVRIERYTGRTRRGFVLGMCQVSRRYLAPRKDWVRPTLMVASLRAAPVVLPGGDRVQNVSAGAAVDVGDHARQF
jgi:hypothetical protein